MPRRIITDWAQGYNTLVDPRRLSPNTEKERTAGSPDMENVSVTRNGALVTSTGYEVVTTVPAGSGAIKNLLDYEPDTTNRYLLVTHGTKHYSMTPSSTTLDDTNLGAYGVEADFVGGTVYNGKATFASTTLAITSYGDLVDGSNQDTIAINNYSLKAQTAAVTEGADTFQAETSEAATANSLTKQINSHPFIKLYVRAVVAGSTISLTAVSPGPKTYPVDYTDNTGTVGVTITNPTTTGGSIARTAFIGAGESTDANPIKSIDITNPMTNALDSSTSGSYVMISFMGRLFASKGSTLFYSKVDDETAIDGSLVFNDIITGAKVEGQRLIIFTRTYHQGIFFQYSDDGSGGFNLSLPLKEAYERKYGNLAFKTLQLKDSDACYWAKEGFVALGAEQGMDELGIPRPLTLSNQIDPTLKNINYNKAEIACSVYDGEEKESYWSVPFSGASYNNRTFVYNWNWKAWTVRTHLYPTTYEKFRTGDDTRDKIFFTDHFNARILKFNDGYSYAGSDYVRRWASKIFTMGADMNMKNYNYLTLTGSMYKTTSFTVRITQDGISKEFVVDGSSLIKNKYGDYIGDNWKGDILIGGGVAADSRFFRFKTKLLFPAEIKKGFEMQFEIFNSAAEQPWKVDYAEIDFDFLPGKRVPSKYINDGLKPQP